MVLIFLIFVVKISLKWALWMEKIGWNKYLIWCNVEVTISAHVGSITVSKALTTKVTVGSSRELTATICCFLPLWQRAADFHMILSLLATLQTFRLPSLPRVRSVAQFGWPNDPEVTDKLNGTTHANAGHTQKWSRPRALYGQQSEKTVFQTHLLLASK